LTKTPLIYSVSHFNLGGLGALFGGKSPPKPPVATGLYESNTNLTDDLQINMLVFVFSQNIRKQAIHIHVP